MRGDRLEFLKFVVIFFKNSTKKNYLARKAYTCVKAFPGSVDPVVKCGG